MSSISRVLIELANKLDQTGLSSQADRVDLLLKQAGPLDWVKEKFLPNFDKNRHVVDDQSDKPAPVLGLNLGGKVYKTKAELDSVDGNQKFLLIDNLIAALAGSGRISKDVTDRLKSSAATDLNSWQAATQAALAAKLIS